MYSSSGFRKEIKSLDLLITVFGKGIDYFPYIYYTIAEAGKKGILKERIPFKIERITSDGQTLLDSEGNIKMDTPKKVWEFETIGSSERAVVTICFQSPLRLKYQGRYGLDYSFNDLIQSIYRRACLLCKLYGEATDSESNDLMPRDSVQKEKKQLDWTDLTHYSARQKRRIKMGGAFGSITLKGNFNPSTMSLLNFGDIFQVGKNTGFGLGKISVKNTYLGDEEEIGES